MIDMVVTLVVDKLFQLLSQETKHQKGVQREVVSIKDEL